MSLPALIVQEPVTNEELSVARSVVQELPDDLAVEFAELFRMDASRQKDFRAGLQAYLLQTAPRDPGSWPMAEPAPLYDPKRHCPAQVIPRKRLSPRDPRSRRALERFHPFMSEFRIEPGWTYDYPSRQLRRTKDCESPKRILQNGLLGYAPDQDLALAILELHLDDGEQQASLTAFAHAYADRRGTVFPGVTLYDAWASGAKIEMPDVECLGIVHDVLDNWKTWKAPVRKQESLYEAIGKLFVPAHHHRALRHALSVAYLIGSPEPLDEYVSNHVQFQAIWEDCSSTPAKLKKRLPEAEDWRSFLEDWIDVVEEKPELQRKALVRANALNGSAVRTQTLVLRMLRENELLTD